MPWILLQEFQVLVADALQHEEFKVYVLACARQAQAQDARQCRSHTQHATVCNVVTTVRGYAKRSLMVFFLCCGARCMPCDVAVELEEEEAENDKRTALEVLHLAKKQRLEGHGREKRVMSKP